MLTMINIVMLSLAMMLSLRYRHSLILIIFLKEINSIVYYFIKLFRITRIEKHK